MAIFLKRGNALINLGATVNIGTKGIQIPSISDFTTDEYGVLRWEAPDISKLQEFNPVLSYVLDINNREFETSNTYFDALQYLYDGDNSVTIKVKIAVYDSGYSKLYYFSKPSQYILTLAQTLPMTVTNACSAVDDLGNIYIYGGLSEDETVSNKLIKFNPITYLIEEYDVTQYNTATSSYFDAPLCKSTMCYYNNALYVFGGNTSASGTPIYSIAKIDLSTKTKLDVAYLPNSNNYGFNLGETIRYENYIYYINREYASSVGLRVFRFDCDTNTLTTLDTTVPFSATPTICKQIIDGGFYCVANNQLYKFDIESATFSQITVTTTETISYTNLKCVYFKNRINLIGSNSETSTIVAYYYDLTNNTINNVNLETELISCNPIVETSNNKIYLACGSPFSNNIIESVIL